LAFTKTVLGRMEEFEHKDIIEATRVQCGLLSDWKTVERKAALNMMIGVYTLDLLWRELGSDDVYSFYEQAPWCPIEEFNYSFEQFMDRAFELDWATVRNWCRVADTWLINPPMIEFKPEEVEPSKLLLFTAKERKGEMTEEDYEVLGSGCSWRKMRQHLLVSRHGESPMNDRVIILDGGILWAKDGRGPRVAIGSLEVDEEDDLIRWGVERIVKAAGVKIRG